MVNPEQQSSWWRWSAVVVLLIAAALRFYGLTWGLPSDVHGYSYHPDEFLTVGSAFNVFTNLDLNPHFYNYPSLYIYLCAVAQAVCAVLGFVNEFGLYLGCRIVCALMGIGAVAVCMLGCRRIYGELAGIAAGAFLAVAALHAQHSHFATVDVPSTLFVAGCLIASLEAYRTDKMKWVIVSAVMGGLAGGTKYNAGLVCLSAAVAPLFLNHYSTSKRLQKSALAIVCAIGAFVLSTPGCLLYTNEFLHGLSYELSHSSVGHGLVFVDTGNAALYALYNLNWAVGTPLLILAAAAVVFSITGKHKDSLILLAFAIPYFLLMTHSQVRFVRYGMPLLPCLAIFCAAACSHIQHLSQGIKKTWASVGGFVLLLTVTYCTGVVALFGGVDTRDSARDYIISNAAKLDCVGFLDLPWFYSPPLGKMIGYGTIRTRQQALSDAEYKIKLLSKISADDKLPEWVVVSDYEIDDAVRLRGKQDLDPDAVEERDRLLRAYAIVERKYLKVKSYQKRVLFVGSSRLPHDMRYVAPRLDIYRLRR